MCYLKESISSITPGLSTKKSAEPVVYPPRVASAPAIGDVLRTTCLLPVIFKKRPDTRIVWLTRKESLPLLENNPYVTEVIPYDTEAIINLSVRSFDRVINLDAGKISSGIAAIAKSKEKTGYILHEKGYVRGTNPAAEEWLQIGVFDNLKKENQRTCQ